MVLFISAIRTTLLTKWPVKCLIYRCWLQAVSSSVLTIAEQEEDDDLHRPHLHWVFGSKKKPKSYSEIAAAVLWVLNKSNTSLISIILFSIFFQTKPESMSKGLSDIKVELGFTAFPCLHYSAISHVCWERSGFTQVCRCTLACVITLFLFFCLLYAPPTYILSPDSLLPLSSLLHPRPTFLFSLSLSLIFCPCFSER